MSKIFNIVPPVGNIVAMKPEMTEKELREFALQLVQDTDATAETWREKIEKDEIAAVVNWLRQSGYTINEA